MAAPRPEAAPRAEEEKGVKPSEGQYILQTVTRATKEKLWTGLLLWSQQRNPSPLGFRGLAGKIPQVFLAGEQHVQRPRGSCQDLSGDWCSEQGEMGRATLGQPTRGRQGLTQHLHTLFLWLILTHPLGLSSGISPPESFSALCR